MPRNWIYFLALILPLGFGFLLLHTSSMDWLWYHGYTDEYYFTRNLAQQPDFMQLMGGWPLPVFTVTAVIYWLSLEEDEALSKQFMLLPLAYVPFAIIGHILVTAQFDATTLYTYPLLIIPIGYIYITPWALLVWLLAKLHLVV